MNLILAIFFRSPFWVQFLAAAGLVWLGWTVQQQDVIDAAARAELLQQAPPATIPITAFSTDTRGKVPVELSVTAQIALEHNTRLIRKTNFLKTGEDLFYVLVDPAAGADINVALAGIVIDPQQLDAFTEWLMQNSTDFGAAGPIATINGLRTSEGNASHAYDAMKNQGMARSPDFFFIEPFIAGRNVTLAALPTGQTQLHWFFYGLAGILALIGIKKLQGRGQPIVASIKPTPAQLLMAAPASAGRLVGGHSPAEMQAAQMLPPQAPAKQPKAPLAKGRIVMLATAAILIGGLITNQGWAYAMLPLGFFGLVYLVMRNGLRSLTKQVGAVVDKFTVISGGAKFGAGAASQPVGASALAPQHFAPTAAEGSSYDGGPIRPGFSFKDLVPKSKRKVAKGPDPFERLAQQRQRQGGNSAGR